MMSREYELHLQKLEEVQVALKELEDAARKAEKAEKAKTVTEPTPEPNTIEAKDVPQDKKSKKKVKEIFESHPHLDVSPGLHTVELDQAA